MLTARANVDGWRRGDVGLWFKGELAHDFQPASIGRGEGVRRDIGIGLLATIAADVQGASTGAAKAVVEHDAIKLHDHRRLTFFGAAEALSSIHGFGRTLSGG